MTQTGIEPGKPHLAGFGIGGDPNSFVPLTWKYIIGKFNIKSVIDIGCGEGHHLKWFLEQGLTVKGTEGSSLAITNLVVERDLVIQVDYTESPLWVNGNFDLAWSTEFVEHIEEQFIPNFVTTFRCAKYLAITHAIPNQPGYHHVNNNTSEYWVNTLKGYGFEYDEEFTKFIRENGDGSYVKQGFLFFKNINE